MGTEGIHDRYINPYTDFGFKKLFGTDMNKELLISFLNALLAGREVVNDVTYMNSEHLGTLELDRRAVFDVYCENDKGEKFLVEMQKGEQEFFKDRSLFYSTFPIREQACRGNWNYELKAVYTIGILNFVFQEQDNSCFHHEVKLVDLRTREVFYDKLTFIYLEMPKFNKGEGELETMFDKWLFVLRNLSSLLERPQALQERVFTRLFEAAEIARFDKNELCQYEESLKNFRDMYSVIVTAEKKGRREGLEEGLAQGLAQGLEKGLAQGREEERLSAARKMKSKGIDDVVISEVTGLTFEEISVL
ncbi:Rpn family recombination-promoting nuclease/putative transposase [Butyricimonas sp.]|uniref:Rpn family recombination-promoting nuclease/putative transposase n=1 Tax=Butyricimonas sp. TaxID=1969738 RepID=UPI0025C40773|nr:Rpn family recombination-promoting nuclease/putative transposase [Butyricimonas sp.]